MQCHGDELSTLQTLKVVIVSVPSSTSNFSLQYPGDSRGLSQLSSQNPSDSRRLRHSISEYPSDSRGLSHFSFQYPRGSRGFSRFSFEYAIGTQLLRNDLDLRIKEFQRRGLLLLWRPFQNCLLYRTSVRCCLSLPYLVTKEFQYLWGEQSELMDTGCCVDDEYVVDNINKIIMKNSTA